MMLTAARGRTSEAIAKYTPRKRRVTVPSPRARSKPTTAPTKTPPSGCHRNVPTTYPHAYAPVPMKTTWPKLTYPVRPVMKFIEYARVAKTRRPTRTVSTYVGARGAAMARTSRKAAIPHTVGPSLGTDGSFIGGFLPAERGGPGSP